MIAVLALLALIAGPVLFAVAARRLRRRATTGSVDALRAEASHAEGALGAAGMLLFAAGVVVLAVMAVWG